MMRKITTLFNANHMQNDDSFKQLLSKSKAHAKLQHFWQAATPESISHHSYASNINEGILTILAYNNAVAAKIKLINASLLTQLQNLQKTESNFHQYKLTAIKVKVQVKSQETHATITNRTLSSGAAATLKAFAEDLGDSPLAEKLNQLAAKSKAS